MHRSQLSTGGFQTLIPNWQKCSMISVFKRQRQSCLANLNNFRLQERLFRLFVRIAASAYNLHPSTLILSSWNFAVFLQFYFICFRLTNTHQDLLLRKSWLRKPFSTVAAAEGPTKAQAGKVHLLRFLWHKHPPPKSEKSIKSWTKLGWQLEKSGAGFNVFSRQQLQAHQQQQQSQSQESV